MMDRDQRNNRQGDRIASDPRVVLIRLDENQGIAPALNEGLQRCRGKLVARMDSDDKMMRTRLQRQFDYLSSNPDVTIVGTQLQAIDWETRQLLSPTRHRSRSRTSTSNTNGTPRRSGFSTTTVMLRCEVMNLGGYPAYRVAQDLGLWLKVVKAGLKIHNLPTVELHYRLHPSRISTARALRREEYAQIVEECWKHHAAM